MEEAIIPWESRNTLYSPEIDYDKVDKIRGMDVCISTSASDDQSGEELLRALKFPFKN